MTRGLIVFIGLSLIFSDVFHAPRSSFSSPTSLCLLRRSCFFGCSTT